MKEQKEKICESLFKSLCICPQHLIREISAGHCKEEKVAIEEGKVSRLVKQGRDRRAGQMVTTEENKILRYSDPLTLSFAHIYLLLSRPRQRFFCAIHAISTDSRVVQRSRSMFSTNGKGADKRPYPKEEESRKLVEHR